MDSLLVDNPNFTVMPSNECQANCDFCFGSKNDDNLDKNYKYYIFLNKLIKTLAKLDSVFKQCSISGGEPTLIKKEFLFYVCFLLRKRFKKMVFTTNSFCLDNVPLHFIDHVNISRHHYNEKKNREIFKTKKIACDKKIEEFCEKANKKGVDVTLNCVLNKEFNDIDFIYKFIEFAKSVGVDYVSFRKEQGDLNDLPVITKINTKKFNYNECPVCVSYDTRIKGMRVTWRYSLKEPSIEGKGIYELIMHPNGNINQFWNNHLYSMPLVKMELEKKGSVLKNVGGLSSCGSTGCG